MPEVRVNTKAWSWIGIGVLLVLRAGCTSEEGGEAAEFALDLSLAELRPGLREEE